MIAQILARTAFEIVARTFARHPDAKHKCFRVKNLLDEEVKAFASSWDLLAKTNGLREVRLVIAGTLGGKIPDKHVADSTKSITYYRNHNPDGLVYLETRVESDEQGLQNIFTLRDSNFLDRSFDEAAGTDGDVARLLVRVAWGEVVGADTPAPTLLLARAGEVIRLLHPSVQAVPVRRFAAFAENLCWLWSHSTSVDAETADRLVGNNLWHLELFPDETWRRGARTARRIELNARHSDLTNGLADLEPEALEAAARRTRFVGPDGSAISLAEENEWRDLCIGYAHNPNAARREKIPYSIFEQLFARDTKGLRLGDRVSAEIDSADPTRVAELNELDVVMGLNSRSAYDADRLVKAPPKEEGARWLLDLLTTPTRRLVERLATPTAKRFFNPAIELVRVCEKIRAHSEGEDIASLKLELSPDADLNNSGIGLFAFLFGPSLVAISERLAGVPGACELRVAPQLAVPAEPPTVDVLSAADSEAGESDSDGEGRVKWLAVPLRVTALDSRNAVVDSIDIEWEPKQPRWLSLYAFAWLLVADKASPIWDRLGAFRVKDAEGPEDWLLPFVERVASLDGLVPLGSTGKDEAPLDGILAARIEFRTEAATRGISVEVLDAYVDKWSSLLERAREQYVPDGSRIAAMDSFLSSDTLVLGDGPTRLMLPTHPVRLRWLSKYLGESCSLAVACLTNEAGFATGGGAQYLTWLESQSPHESPPITIGDQGVFLFARTEEAWFEEFAPLKEITAGASVDPAALGSIAAHVARYLDAHPYKRDGLTLLLVLPSSDDMAASLLERVTRGGADDVRVGVTVAAPRARWEQIARNVERLHADEQSTSFRRFFPPYDLSFLEYERGGDLQGLLEGQLFDISVVTHVLQESTLSQQNTEPPMARPGAFHPLHDRPAMLDTSASGGSISIVMRPAVPDPVLESWGTLVVRSNRSRPVAPAQPENTDFAELRVNFEDSARVFNALHLSSHWVITLERHISREQIESVEAGAPDVLSVEEGVGNNGLSTLIVSSRSGRELIESRLVRKLRKVVPTGLPGGDTASALESLARHIYDETRRIAPYLALQAMGVSRVTEEILGLAVARSVAEEREPVAVSVSDGMAAWISLDEHTDWFGGISSVRADMCRISFARVPGGGLEVDVLVLESKLRQGYDPHGVTQVEETQEFFQNVLLAPGPGEARKVDAEMWRARILSAIESSAAEARSYFHRDSATESDDGAAIPPDIRHAFRGGEFRLRSLKGLYSICLWEHAGKDLVNSVEGRVTVVRSTRAHIFDLVTRRLAPTDAITSIGREASQETDETRKGPLSAVAGAGASLENPVITTDSPASAGSPLAVPASTADGATGAAPGIRVGQPHMDTMALRRLYDEVLACFSEHNVAVSAGVPDDQPIIEGPASILFKVRPGPGVDPKKLSEKGQALKLALGLEQEQNVAFDIDRGYVTVDVPKKPDQRYYVDAGKLWSRWKRPVTALAAPLGEDRFGNIVQLEFSSANSPHLLVGGTTGSGKSEALNTLLFGLVRHYGADELRLVLVDPKGTELGVFGESAHLQAPIGWDDADALMLLQMAVQEMQRRYLLLRESGKKSLAEYNAAKSKADSLPWWLVVLDEYADLTHDPQSKREIEQELKRLAQKARAAGIHVVIATQKPSAEVISTNLRSNLPAQLALRVKSATESRVIMDETGAENLNGKGDALLKADGRVRRIQCAQVAVEDQRLS